MGTKIFVDSKSVILQNKDIDGGLAGNRDRITLPKNDTDSLAALERKEATLAYDTTLQKVVVDDGSGFAEVGGGGGGGDATELQGTPISSTPPTTDQVLKFDGSEWTPTDSGGGAVTSVNGQTGDVFVASTTLDNISNVSIGTQLLFNGDNAYDIGDGNNAARQINTNELSVKRFGMITFHDNGSTPMHIVGPPVISPGEYSFAVPGNPGTSGQVLATDGTGITSFVDIGSSPINHNLLSDATSNFRNIGDSLHAWNGAYISYIADTGDNFVLLADPSTRSLWSINSVPVLDFSNDNFLAPSVPIQMFNSDTDPTSPTAGMVYFNTILNKLKVYNGTTWQTITSV